MEKLDIDRLYWDKNYRKIVAKNALNKYLENARINRESKRV